MDCRMPIDRCLCFDDIPLVANSSDANQGAF
jgi:hypothetical protein